MHPTPCSPWGRERMGLFASSGVGKSGARRMMTRGSGGGRGGGGPLIGEARR